VSILGRNFQRDVETPWKLHNWSFWESHFINPPKMQGQVIRMAVYRLAYDDAKVSKSPILVNRKIAECVRTHNHLNLFLYCIKGLYVAAFWTFKKRTRKKEKKSCTCLLKIFPTWYYRKPFLEFLREYWLQTHKCPARTSYLLEKCESKIPWWNLIFASLLERKSLAPNTFYNF